MSCRKVQEQIEAGELDGAARAHLETCVTCRAGWDFHQRVAQAFRTMPRAAAPDSLARRVMAAVRENAPAEAPESRRPSAARGYPALRPWEMGGLAALCLAILALVPVAAARWGSLPVVRAMLDAWAHVRGGLSGGGARVFDGRELGAAVRLGLERLGDAASALGATGFPLGWLGGVTAFALGLYLWLSWRHAGVPGRTGDTRA